jgi:hypothetical protein
MAENQYLLIKRPGAEPERITLDPAAPCTLGRSQTNTVPLSDASISRNHAQIFFRDGSFWIEDLGSKNGTKLGSRRVDAPAKLKPGDHLQLGSVHVVFSGSETPSKIQSARIADIDAPLNVRAVPIEEISSSGAIDTRSFAATFSPERMGAFLQAMDRVGKELLVLRPLDELFELVVGLAAEILKADRTVILLRDGQGELQTKAVSQTGRGLEEEIVVSRSIARLAVDQRQAIRTDDAQSDTRFREQQSVITQRIHSAMCVPLWHEGDVLGLIYVDNVAAPVPFEDTDLRLLTLIAHLTAVKVRETESWIAQQQQQQQLNQAADIQRALLPDAPIRVGSLDVAGANTPSQDVGGDYFDFITTSPERVIVGLGDVSGKGMPAALLMTFLNATVRAQVEAERPLADGMRHVNARIFQKVQGARFITLVLAEADGSTGEIRYVNAGHNPPFLLRRSGTIDQLTEGGLLLGIRDKEEYATGTCTLGPGEILLFYSDGVTEARNPAGEEFGEERLQEFLRKRATMGAEELTETLLAFVREFCAPAKPQDDVTVVVMHRP